VGGGGGTCSWTTGMASSNVGSHPAGERTTKAIICERYFFIQGGFGDQKGGKGSGEVVDREVQVKVGQVLIEFRDGSI